MMTRAPATSTPFTYQMDYGSHLIAPNEFIEKVAAAPPHLLHVGHDTPFDNSWGPFSQDDAIDSGQFPARLSPQVIQQRTADIKDYVDRLHEVGVRIVIPYICNQSLGGNPETRTGIWEMYDHWEQYSAFGYGPKPAADPIDWMTRERNGRVHYNYEMRHPYFARFDHHRYAPCQNNPHYNHYQKGMVISLTNAGYDGVFVDNNSLNCYCSHCQEKFRTYLADRYSNERIRERFGAENLSQISMGYRGSPMEWVKTDPDFMPFVAETCSSEELTSLFGTSNLDEAFIEEMGNFWLSTLAEQYRRHLERRLSTQELERKFGSPDASLWGIRTPQERALWAETKRFRAQSIADNLAMIKETGNSARDGFIVIPNWGPLQQIEGNGTRLMEQWGHDVNVWRPIPDGIMFEEFTDPGMIAPGFYLDFVLQYKFALANRVTPANLCYVTRKEGAELAYAESAAGGGGSYVPSLHDQPLYPELQNKYHTFFKEHAHLLDGYRSHAHVALAYCYDEAHMENVEHLRQVQKLTRYLLDQHILFDYVVEDDLADAPLSRYRVLILPEVRYMNDTQIQAVENFVQTGGAAILTRETGRYDTDGKPRSPGGFASLLDGGVRDETGVLTVERGGRCVHSFDLSNLLPSDRISRDDALHYATSELVSKADVPGDPRYHALAQLDQALGVDFYLAGGSLLQHITAGLGHPPCVADALKGIGVRFNAYIKTEGSKGMLVVHAVNYNLPLVGEIKDDRIIPVEDLTVQLSVPNGWNIQQAQACEPGGDPQALTFNVNGGLLEIVLPTILFYKLISVSAVVKQ
ncbi:MAG: hypothetical protein CMJ49_05275 [Planctomycetaceae bacterium]|nr:hypothetical protein [Planctomycetaceae bacterium]